MEHRIPKKEYDELCAEQNNSCAICGVKHCLALSVDVDPVTHKCRGLLCKDCAKVIKYCHESLHILMYASLYLEKWNETDD